MKDRAKAGLGKDEFERLRPWRARGLEELAKRIGDITEELDARLRQRQPVRVLEVGFGFGTVLMELRRRYGDRLELHGINRNVAHGNWEIIKKNVLETGMLTPAELGGLTPPTLHYGDVSAGLPLPDASIDLAYSQVSFIYFDDKIRFLEDLHRVLTPGGSARIDLWIDREDLPAEYATMLEIWDEGRKIPFWDYIKGFKNLGSGKGKRRPYLRMQKGEGLDFNLELVNVFNLNEICSTWWGKKSVYRVRRTPAAEGV